MVSQELPPPPPEISRNIQIDAGLDEARVVSAAHRARATATVGEQGSLSRETVAGLAALGAALLLGFVLLIYKLFLLHRLNQKYLSMLTRARFGMGIHETQHLVFEPADGPVAVATSTRLSTRPGIPAEVPLQPVHVGHVASKGSVLSEVV
tara:strand:- start:759 stop:1211 length:453 start_codon:yes stop_codon:yes gene_type:complete